MLCMFVYSCKFVCNYISSWGKASASYLTATGSGSFMSAGFWDATRLLITECSQHSTHVQEERGRSHRRKLPDQRGLAQEQGQQPRRGQTKTARSPWQVKRLARMLRAASCLLQGSRTSRCTPVFYRKRCHLA